MKAHTLLLTLALALGLAACGQEQRDASPAGGSAAPADATPASVDGKAVYAARCALCHGKTGEGRGTNPRLAGLSVADIESRLNDYRAGKQMGPDTAIMAAAAKSLSDEQIAAIAGFLGE